MTSSDTTETLDTLPTDQKPVGVTGVTLNDRYAIQDFPVDTKTALINPALDLFSMARSRTIFTNPQAALLPALNLFGYFGGKVANSPLIVGTAEEAAGPAPLPPELAHHVVGMQPSNTGSVIPDVITNEEVEALLESIWIAEQSPLPTEQIVGSAGPLNNLGKVLVPMLIRLIPELLRLITPAL